MDKYDDDSKAGGSWEDELLRVIENAKDKKAIEGSKEDGEIDLDADYEVIQPEVPESIKKLQEEEEELVRGIYD